MVASERVFYVICGVLLILGGIVFVWGGSSHPPTDARLGAVGSEEYFRNFVRHVVEHGHWQLIHTGILAGPVCWALGGVGAGSMLRAQGEAHFSALGIVALAMGATAWAVTFVFDGFVALRYAETIAARPAGDITALLIGFQANQVVVIRLGLVSWILMGVGMAALGTSGIIAATSVSRARLVRQITGAAGVVLGAWPTVAWAIGVFDPGPFTSRWWALTALLTAAWFVAMGIIVLTQATSKTVR